MITLFKEVPYPAEPNYRYKVNYIPAVRVTVERPNGWFTHDLKKVSKSSCERIHRIYLANLCHKTLASTFKTAQFLVK